MPEKKSTRRFVFRGNALPLGGRIVRRGGQESHETIPGPPASALPVTGGKNKAVSRGSSYQDIFRWGATLAQSEGQILPDGTVRTTVTSSIADAYAHNKPHVFEAGLIRVSMVAEHPYEGQPSITPSELVFGGGKGMQLEGSPVELEFDNDLKDFPTFEAFEKEYQTNQAFFDKYQRCLTHPGGVCKFGEPLPRLHSGYVELSFVRRVRYKKKWRDGNVLYFKGFGRIHFGEVMMKESSRRVTMVRLAMGSDTGADLTLGEVDPNGSWGN